MVADPQVVPIEKLESACTTRGYRGAERAELFWSFVHPVSPGQVALSWISRDSLARYRASGLVHGGPVLHHGVEEARRRVVERPRRLAALGAVHLWRTITSEQIAAVIGSPYVGSRRSTDMELLFEAGLVQRGFAYAGDRRTSLPPIWRPDIAACTAHFEDELSFGERLGVYAGQEWSFGAQATWHNLVTTELSLRVAEYTPVATVFGELLAGARLLFSSDPSLAKSKRSADAVWIRDDGLRIVVESTATAAAIFRRRVDFWIDAFMADPDRSSVLCVVDIADPSKPDRVAALVRRAILDATHASQDRVHARVAEQICFVRYTDWFPGPGLVHERFFGLGVERPTGPAGTRWERVDLLDPYAVPFAPADPDGARAVIENSKAIYGVPHWLRRGGFDTEALVRRLAGFPPAGRMTEARRNELRSRLAGPDRS